jgi:predicted GTPase
MRLATAQVLPPPRQDVEEQDIDKSTIAVAIVGRPNIGKSSLVNGITGAPIVTWPFSVIPPLIHASGLCLIWPPIAAHLPYCSAAIRLTFNAAGKERCIVSNMRGTTRDAIDTDITLPDGQSFKLIDTAGIRRRSAVAGAAQFPQPDWHAQHHRWS